MGESTQDEQAVLIYLDGQNLPDEIYEEYDVLTLDEQLTNVLEEAETGEYDGEEYGPTETTLFLYGPDAEALYRTIESTLMDYPLCEGARIVVRPGGPGISGREFILPKKK